MKTEVAVSYFGTPVALASALGITRQAVNDWGEFVPEGRAYQLEVLTEGALKAPRPETKMSN